MSILLAIRNSRSSDKRPAGDRETYILFHERSTDGPGCALGSLERAAWAVYSPHKEDEVAGVVAALSLTL